MRIVSVADLHGFLPDELPEGDVLVIAGDVMPVDDHTFLGQSNFAERKLNPWLIYQQEKFTDVIGIAGNHDFLFDPAMAGRWALGSYAFPDAGPRYARDLEWTYLFDDVCKVGWYVFYGTPYVPHLPMWAFHSTEEEIAHRLSRVPGDGEIDVFITHDPPYSAGDKVIGGEHVGSTALASQLRRIHPLHVVCGHIHEDYGEHTLLGDMPVHNSSYVDVQYKPVNQPLVFDIEGEK